VSGDAIPFDSDEPEMQPAPRWRRRRVVLGAAIFVAVCLALYAALPWILPLAIVEGPLVQQADAHGAVIVWWTSRPGACDLRLDHAGRSEAVPVQHDGRRHRAVVEGLEPGGRFPYRIRSGERSLGAYTLRALGAPATPLHMLVFGDSGKGSREQYLLAARMAERQPDLVLHTGDLVYPDGDRHDYAERFFRPYRELLSSVAFWPSLGNHDVSEPHFGAPYAQVFDLPSNGPAGLPAEYNYAFQAGNVRVAVIDSNLDENALRERVAPWLAEQLAAGAASWRFVVLHHPPYTVGPHGPTARVQSALVPIFDATGVDVVFGGHDHLYCRTKPMRGGQAVESGGAVYIVTGAGGAKLYKAAPVEDHPAYIAAYHDATHSFTEIEITESRLAGRQIDISGRIVDEWAIDKPAAAQ
jgi:3',5'-cyclic AMP phosphodiesterase CpdA